MLDTATQKILHGISILLTVAVFLKNTTDNGGRLSRPTQRKTAMVNRLTMVAFVE